MGEEKAINPTTTISILKTNRLRIELLRKVEIKDGEWYRENNDDVVARALDVLEKFEQTQKAFNV